jgi:TPP-dependent pyruvate/acetoin dehydrogenase alpha subunit
MTLTKELKLRIFEKAALCRAFENEVFQQVKLGVIKLPVYLSAGQEYIAATLSVALEEMGIKGPDRDIFIQHRGHSSYICFGGDIESLILELLGDPSGCANGMGGSASIHSKNANIYGHDGLMGTQGPIATGSCYASKRPTLCFSGDAAAEEDYFLASIGWASTKNLPIWFVIEDNNYSILTEKNIRRNWSMTDLAKGFRMDAYELNDDPNEIFRILPSSITKPLLLNINTNRLFWHAGAGIDSDKIFDRHKDFERELAKLEALEINENAKSKVRKSWNAII